MVEEIGLMVVVLIYLAVAVGIANVMLVIWITSCLLENL